MVAGVRVVRLVAAMVIAGFLLPVVVSDEVAAYPSDTPPANLPPGSVKVPFTIQTFQYSTPPPRPFADARCWSKTFVVFDGQYGIEYTDVNGLAAYLNWQSPATNQVQYSGDVRSTSASTANGRRSWTLSAVDGSPTVTFPDQYGVPLPISAPPPDPPGGDCRDALPAWKAQDEGYAANAILWSLRNDNDPPAAGFTYEVTDLATNEVTFTSTSADDGGAERLASLWTLEPGVTSTERDPVHRFPRAGTFPVTLRVTDALGLSDTVTQDVTIPGGLVVNSTADRPAENPADQGCDTGQVVGGAPECTLRAAIEAANDLGGGTITFDIAGAGVPEIAVGSPLPAIPGGVVIDGTSQAGGLVGVAGPSPTRGTRGILLTGGTSEVRGLVISGFDIGIQSTGGSGHVIEGNHLGVDAAGTGVRELLTGGSFAGSPNLEIRDNVVAAQLGIVVGEGSTGAAVSGNAVGATTSGLELGAPVVAILISSAGAEVVDNRARAQGAGVLVLGADAGGATVAGNIASATLGDGGGGGAGYAIRVDGAPDASVTGNDVTAGPERPGISVTGSVQSGNSAEGGFLIGSPADPADTPVTGGRALIVDNDIAGTVAEGSVESTGVQSWAGASDLVVEGNEITDVATGVTLDGGEGHRIVANAIGSESVLVGIEITDAAGVVVGEASAPNVIESSGYGVDLEGASTGAAVTANQITGAEVGIQVDDEASGSGVTGNVVRSGVDAIAIDGDDATVTGNLASENVRGVVSDGEGVEITMNRIGVAATGSDVLGNRGTGVTVSGGDAQVERNAIVGSGGDGVAVTGGVASLRGNQISDSAGAPISTSTGPGAPELKAAIRTTSGTSTRTTLVLDGLDGEAGDRLEVFADDSCDPGDGGEARYVLDLNRLTRAGEEAKIIQIQGSATRRFFTVTATDPTDGTSALSECVEARTHPDSDGDGSPDPLDGLLQVEDDPSSAIVATDNEELLVLSAVSAEVGEGGPLPPVPLAMSQVAVVDDPNPAGHPGGFTLPYGALQFRVELAEPGGRAAVLLSTVLANSLPPGAAYWKYGPPTTGAAARWYDFAYDEETGTGASASTMDLPTGISRSFLLLFQDGARGDSDGAGNGTITDPGGITLGAPTGTPTTTAVPTTAPPTTSVSTTAAPTTAAPSAEAPAGTMPTTGSAASGELARTGADLATVIEVAAVALVVGVGLIAIQRRRRHLTSP